MFKKFLDFFVWFVFISSLSFLFFVFLFFLNSVIFESVYFREIIEKIGIFYLSLFKLSPNINFIVLIIIILDLFLDIKEIMDKKLSFLNVFKKISFYVIIIYFLASRYSVVFMST